MRYSSPRARERAAFDQLPVELKRILYELELPGNAIDIQTLLNAGCSISSIKERCQYIARREYLCAYPGIEDYLQ